MGMRFLNLLKKYWQLILGCLALAVVVIGLNDVVFLPKRNLELVNATAYVQTDNCMVMVDNHHQRLIFADKNAEVTKVMETGTKDVPYDKIFGVFAIDDFIYVTATVSKDEGIVIDKEVIGKYTCDGQFVGNYYEAQYTVADNFVRAGFQYVDKSDWGLLLTSFRDREIRFEEVNYQGARLLAKKELNFIPWIAHRVDEMKYLIQGADSWYYFYDGTKNIVSRLNREGTPYENYIYDHRYPLLYVPLSLQLLIKTYLFWGAIGILSCLVLLMLWRFICAVRKNQETLHLVKLISGAVFAAAIISGFYTRYVYHTTMEHYKVMARVECRIVYNSLMKQHGYLFDIIKHKKTSDILENYQYCCHIQNFANTILDVVTTNGSKEAFSGALLIKDEDGRTLIFADTTLDEPDGTVYWDLDVTDKNFAGMPDEFVIPDEDDNGKYLTAFRKLYRDDGTCFGYLNLDINIKKIEEAQKTIALKAFMELLSIMMILYIVLWIYRRAVTEFTDVWSKYKAGQTILGAELIGTCSFLGAVAFNFDAVLWVFALKELCTNYGGDYPKLVGMIAISIAVVAFTLSFVYPKLRALLGDRVVFLLGAIGMFAGFGCNLVAFTLHKPWLFALGYVLYDAFGQGLFKPSILTLPSRFKEVEQRSKAVNTGYIAYTIGIGGAVLAGAVIQNAMGFVNFYWCCVGFLGLTGVVILFALSQSSEISHENRRFNYKVMWQFFARFKGMGYLFAVCVPQIVIFVFKCKICGSILARSGIDAQTVTFVMICGYILYALIPRDRITARYGVKFTAIIFSCCMAFCFAMTAGNRSTGWLIILPVLLSVFYTKDMSDNVLMDLADKDGYEQKVIVDSNVFLENLVSVLISFGLSALLIYDDVTVRWATGMIIFAAVGIGLLFERLGKRI